MTRWLPHAALLAVLFGAWFVRAELVPRRALSANPYAALDDSESSYRLRLVELSLAAGRAPRTDAFLAAGEPAAVPFPPLIHAMLATIATHALASDSGARELGGVEEDALERLALGVSPLLGLVAVGLAFAVCAWSARGPQRIWGGVCAAAVLAFLPASISGEGAGALRAEAWIAVLALAELAALSAALRAREQVDVTLGALLGGLSSGLSLLAGVEAWPLSLGALGVLFALMARVPRPQKRDAWRAACLFLLVTCAVVVLAEPGRSLERVLPRFADGVTVERIYANAGFALCWVLLYERRRDPFHAVLLAAGFLAFACALFDARFQVTLQVVLAASISALVADPIGASGASAQRVSRAVLALVLAATAVLPWLVAQPVEIALQREFAGGLRWLRTGSSSPGPFNSPDAGQDWRVWTAPRLAGSVAYHARRPLVASSVGSASFGPALDAGDEGFLARLDEEIALFVVATPRMLEDASLGEDRPLSALRTLERFALDGGEPPPGWRRVHATSTRVGPDGRAALDGERGGPLVSIWRRESAAAGALPTMKQ